MKTLDELIEDLKAIANNLEKQIECTPDKCKTCDKCVFCDIADTIDEIITIKSHIKEIIK